MEGEISEEKIEEYARGWEKKIQKKEAARRKRVRHAREKAEAIAELAFDSYRVDEVWIFGSLARKKMRKNSDLDLMISGLSPEKYWSFLTEAEKIASPFKIDIVLKEEASRAFKKRVRREGVKLKDEEKNLDPKSRS